MKVFTQGSLLLLLLAFCSLTSSCESENVVSFGVITDVHQDIMHDAEDRLSRFVEEMNTIQADFIIQLGDFCRPYEHNIDFLNIFNDFGGPRYHVIGNHDMDGGFTRDSVIKYWGMESNYYSFDENGFHFVVLDGNDNNPDPNRASGYARFIGQDQLNWLKEDLESTEYPAFLFSHQPLRGEFGVENANEIRTLLEDINDSSGKQKVIASLNGHSHADTVFRINDIYYIEINSSSYEWLGGDYQHESYSKEVHNDYPYISYTAPYEQALWALVEISSKGEIRITGKESDWKGPSPGEIGYPGRKDGIGSSSRIRDTVLVF